MPPPFLLYVQMLVMQLQTRDTNGARQTRLRAQVSEPPSNDSNTKYPLKLHVHVLVTDTVEHLLIMYVLNWLRVCKYMQCVSQDVVFTCHLPAI